MGRTIYSERNNDAGQRVVEVGKWSAVPTGPWCGWTAPEDRHHGQNFVSDGHQACWRTTPRGGDSVLQWWILSIEGDRTHFRAYKWSRKTAYERTTFASPEDLWSCAYNNAEPFGRKKGDYFGKSWTMSGPALGKIDEDGRYEGWYLRRALMVRPMDELEEMLDILQTAGACARAQEVVAMAIDTNRLRAEDRAKTAQETRAQNAARKERGGNPKSFKVGDRVLLDRTVTYNATGDQRFFWYTPPSWDANSKPRFFTQVDANGLGVGNSYKVRKKDLYRACLAAFDQLATEVPEEPISLHTKMALLADQAAAEARRAAQHQDTRSCTCDA